MGRKKQTGRLAKGKLTRDKKEDDVSTKKRTNWARILMGTTVAYRTGGIKGRQWYTGQEDLRGDNGIQDKRI